MENSILLEAGDLLDQPALSDVPGSQFCPLVPSLDAEMVVMRPDLPKPGGRLILVGDVHGCLAELKALMLAARVDEAVDTVVLLGDLVNKGPDSLGVLRWAMANEHFVLAIRGNHEDGALLARAHLDGGEEDACASSFAAWVGDLEPLEIDFLRALPLMIVLSRFDVVCVHAGLLPGVPLAEQPHVIATKLRIMVPIPPDTAAVAAAAGGGAAAMGLAQSPAVRTWAPWESIWQDRQERTQPHVGAVPWWNLWGERTRGDGACRCPWQQAHVVFGHDAQKRLQLGKRATGLDTGCFTGKVGCRLTAMVLGPSVPSAEEIARLRAQGCDSGVETGRPGLLVSVASTQ